MTVPALVSVITYGNYPIKEVPGWHIPRVSNPGINLSGYSAVVAVVKVGHTSSHVFEVNL